MNNSLEASTTLENLISLNNANNTQIKTLNTVLEKAIINNNEKIISTCLKAVITLKKPYFFKKH